MTEKIVIKYVLIFIGSISIALGLIGVFIPVLPTTPFLLLASCCFARSSKRLYNWLISHRILGEYIYNYVTYKAVKRNVKIGSIVFLWATLLISIFLAANLHIRIFLLLVGAGVSIHLIKLKTLREEEEQAEPMAPVEESNENPV